MECVILFMIWFYTSLNQEASAQQLNVTVTTDPSGPSYKAGSFYKVICSISGGSPPYGYERSVGCTSTNIFTTYTQAGAILGRYITTPLMCRNAYRCRVTDSNGIQGVGEVIIESVKDIAIQIFTGPNSFLVTQNISILTVNESGRFLDIVCSTGLKRPNIGTWILPNNTYVTQRNEVLLPEKGGGVNFPGYTTLKLRDKQSLSPGDTGLYTCVIPDINMVERESHIWILQEQVFEPSHPEYFNSYSSSKELKLNCAFSTKPGEILWVIGGETVSTNASFTVSQRLLNVSSALYEGSLDIFDSKFMSRGLILRCVLRSIVIGNHLDPRPSRKFTKTRHSFIQGIIGQSQTIPCSFASKNVTSIQIYSRGEILVEEQGRKIQNFRITLEDSTHNRKYICIGLVPGGASQYINMSIVAIIPPHALTMHIGDFEKVVLAGESLLVDLSAIKLRGFTNNQLISCTNQFGTSLSELDGFKNPVTTGLTLHLQVSVEHIKLSYAGLHICTAFLETPPFLDNISDTNNATITVKIPSPVVNMSKPIKVVQTGAVATFTCSATLNTTYLDLPVHAVFAWMIGGASLPSSDRFQLDSSATEVGSDNITYHSVLRIAPVTPEKDESILECRVFITGDNSNVYILDSITVNTSVDVRIQGAEPLHSTPIQIRIAGLEMQCLNWIRQPNNASNLNDITSKIIKAVSDHCSCPYSVGYITEEHFLCSDESSTYVTYRAMIYSTNEAEAETLAGYVQDYVSMGGDSNFTFTIDSNCVALIDSFNDSLCDEDVASAGTLDSIVLIVVGVSLALMILFLSLVIISVLCVCCIKKQKNAEPRPSPVQNNEVSTLSNRMNENNAYGMVKGGLQPRPLPMLSAINEPETVKEIKGAKERNYPKRKLKISNDEGQSDDDTTSEYEYIN